MSIWSKIFRSAFDKNFNHFGLKRVDGMTRFRTNLTDLEKLQLVLSNPAFLKIVALQCDMFSLGKFYVYKDDKEVKDHKLLKLLNNPNPFQNNQEFLWEYMFWQMLGLTQIYIWDKDFDKLIPNKMYILRPYSLDLPKAIIDGSDKIFLSQKTLDAYMDVDVKYTYLDGSNFSFPYKNLITIADLGHPISRTTYHSRVDALIKVVDNNEAAMDSLNINIRYSGKFMVAGKADPDDVNQLPLSEDEKEDIERKALNHKPVEAVKSMVDIKRYVDDASKQQLPEFWLHTYFVLGSQYGIPRDVLEAYESSTYENQEKARGSHVSYCLQPKADLLTGKLDVHFGLIETGEEIVLDWEHLPFMQVFAEQRAKAQKTQSESVLNLLKAGIPMEEINSHLDTSFTTDESKQKLGGPTNGTRQEESEDEGV